MGFFSSLGFVSRPFSTGFSGRKGRRGVMGGFGGGGMGGSGMWMVESGLGG